MDSKCAVQISRQHRCQSFPTGDSLLPSMESSTRPPVAASALRSKHDWPYRARRQGALGITKPGAKYAAISGASDGFCSRKKACWPQVGAICALDMECEVCQPALGPACGNCRLGRNPLTSTPTRISEFPSCLRARYAKGMSVCRGQDLGAAVYHERAVTFPCRGARFRGCTRFVSWDSN